MKSRYVAGAAILAVAGLPVSACGGGSSKSASMSPSKVQSCLQQGGYGVTVLPASDVTGSGAENRGPGQTAELLVGENGAHPHIGADDADAVIAFWNSHAHAANSPNARDEGLGTHAYAIGAVTVQPTVHLVLFAVRTAKTVSARRAKFFGEVKKIERCV
jgi:hypothetical protein